VAGAGLLSVGRAAFLHNVVIVHEDGCFENGWCLCTIMPHYVTKLWEKIFGMSCEAYVFLLVRWASSLAVGLLFFLYNLYSCLSNSQCAWCAVGQKP
jgi:hypothetical protein